MLLHSAMLHLRLSSHDTFQKTGVLDCLKYTKNVGFQVWIFCEFYPAQPQ